MAYAGTEDLARALRIREPSGAQGTALAECLEAAWYEINSECLGTGTVEFGTPYPALAVEVNIERAVEHWQQRESPFGILGLGGEVPVRASRDSWDRHAHKLSPLKESWGIA